ncbi:hypothetical protein PILCRDRAFT_277626 [Piloderma croceum F 1598]|uniref:Uncharacterized protein n=1 Tax=Piloderma croceum (strain F 1598) TaxID=765440 RepID=A0A0C3BLX1_PILCF|nr:hypothetical protein PILCRDRAFT_277626 [Piloderma croceum F 1598]
MRPCMAIEKVSELGKGIVGDVFENWCPISFSRRGRLGHGYLCTSDLRTQKRGIISSSL